MFHVKQARINKPESKQISNLQKNVKAKISRLAKKGVQSDLLPDLPKITGSETRAELNVKKQLLKDFTNRTNTNYQYKNVGDIFVPVKEYNELERTRKRVNDYEKKLHNRRKDWDYRVISEELQGIQPTKRTIGQDRHKEPALKYTKDNFGSIDEFNKYQSKLEKRIQSLKDHENVFKDRIATAAQNRFGSKADEFIKKVNAMSVEDAIMLYETTDVFNLDFFYEDDFAISGELDDDDKMELLDFVVKDFPIK